MFVSEPTKLFFTFSPSLISLSVGQLRLISVGRKGKCTIDERICKNRHFKATHGTLTQRGKIPQGSRRASKYSRICLFSIILQSVQKFIQSKWKVGLMKVEEEVSVLTKQLRTPNLRLFACQNGKCRKKTPFWLVLVGQQLRSQERKNEPRLMIDTIAGSKTDYQFLWHPPSSSTRIPWNVLILNCCPFDSIPFSISRHKFCNLDATTISSTAACLVIPNQLARLDQARSHDVTTMEHKKKTRRFQQPLPPFIHILNGDLIACQVVGSEGFVMGCNRSL